MCWPRTCARRTRRVRRIYSSRSLSISISADRRVEAVQLVRRRRVAAAQLSARVSNLNSARTIFCRYSATRPNDEFCSCGIRRIDFPPSFLLGGAGRAPSASAHCPPRTASHRCGRSMLLTYGYGHGFGIFLPVTALTVDVLDRLLGVHAAGHGRVARENVGEVAADRAESARRLSTSANARNDLILPYHGQRPDERHAQPCACVCGEFEIFSYFSVQDQKYQSV